MRSAMLLMAGLLVTCAAYGTGMSNAEYVAAMAAMHAGDVPVASPAAEIKPAQAVQGSEIIYAKVDGKPVRGYLSRPANAKGPLPGIIVI
ncbi:MAG: hypothetical protein ACRESU_06155, partial [Gammaproteobacteria bacterium]